MAQVFEEGKFPNRFSVDVAINPQTGQECIRVYALVASGDGTILTTTWYFTPDEAEQQANTLKHNAEYLRRKAKPS